ncbi:MAG: ABC transporter ATP-binding protein [Planctomycetes bacterium]|nr:ABC transporter ATP-binding protein [Planctomycetota bacterium]HNZ67401.1 ABC transporter ATP-binding protein [Planctomycetota bacterium]HON44622.1 ABC transporter ATP-binding protein [Planctomycetota bacterium]HPY74035.1 ABC transporter ATP-binding protein [Planctomycetota bacterium]HRU50789.1 ABC transporter ATP-binding protein [Planctomycetota bacterium]
MISVHNISKSYGKQLAVDDLTLTISSGELFAFLGPNGAGKTTTIKMMVGLLQPTQGQIFINGYSMAKDHLLAKKCLAYVPDQPYLYDKLSGKEMLEFVGRMYSIPEKTIQERIQQVIERFELHDFINTLCENYSHGMKQRLVFACALLHMPTVWIIDEPMVGLDPKSVRIVKNMLREEVGKGASIFMSTHSLEVAEETADRIGIIHLGKLIALGTLQELRDKLEGKKKLEDIFLELTLS